jgi:hypothetical protein
MVTERIIIPIAELLPQTRDIGTEEWAEFSSRNLVDGLYQPLVGKNNFCGPRTIQAAFSQFGVEFSLVRLVKEFIKNKLMRPSGMEMGDIVRAGKFLDKNHRFEFIKPRNEERNIQSLIGYLEKGAVAFLGVFEGRDGHPDELDEHIVLAVGYNPKTKEIAILDPSLRKEWGGSYNRFGLRAIKVEDLVKMWVWSGKGFRFVNEKKEKIRPKGGWVEAPMVVMMLKQLQDLVLR